tara:strand:+ start:855 stop:1646 length:792 start_codon:yes stop_codon:yes gene_type:complete
MRLVKSITYKRAKSLKRFSLIKQKIEKSIVKNPDSNIASKGIEGLKYFLVIDYKDVSKKLGVTDSFNDINLLFGTKEDNEAFMSHIRKKNSEPSFFKNLGLLYDISGCYLVATSKDVKKNISIYNTLGSISCKFDLNDLPKEFKKMCSEYENKELNFDNTNIFNFSNILNIPNEERDEIIESIVSSLAFTEIPKQDLYPDFDLENVYDESLANINIETIIESKIGDIYDINFLQQVMETAIQNDNLELCAKIRDRISFIKKNK